MIRQHLVSVLVASVESLLYTGLTYGWPLLVSIFVAEGYYADLCRANGTAASYLNSTQPVTTEHTPAESGCTKQTVQLNLIFSLSTVVNIGICFFAGVVFDWLGTWVSKGLTTLFCMTGLLFFACASPSSPHMLYLAMISLAIGGALMFIVNLQFANLFPTVRTTLIAMMNGLLLSSQFFFWLVRVAYEKGLALKIMMYTYCAPLAVFCALSPFFAPKTRVPYPLPKNFTYGVANSRKRAALSNSGSKSEERKGSKMPLLTRPHKLKMSSRLGLTLYLLNIVHFSVVALRNMFFIGTFDTWARSVTDNPASVRDFINWYGITSMLGAFAGPLVGVVDDVMFRFYKRRARSKMAARMKSATTFALFTTFISVLLSASVLSSTPFFLYLSLALQALSRIANFSSAFVCVTSFYSAKHSGKLIGLTYAVGGGFTLLQYPLFVFVLQRCNGNFFPINVIFLIACAFTSILPLFLRSSWSSLEKNFAAVSEAPDVVDNNYHSGVREYNL